MTNFDHYVRKLGLRVRLSYLESKLGTRDCMHNEVVSYFLRSGKNSLN